MIAADGGAHDGMVSYQIVADVLDVEGVPTHAKIGTAVRAVGAQGLRPTQERHQVREVNAFKGREKMKYLLILNDAPTAASAATTPCAWRSHC